MSNLAAFMPTLGSKQCLGQSGLNRPHSQFSETVVDVYHIWCNLKASENDLEFAAGIRTYFDRLKEQGKIEGYRITRCKLGLRPANLREFQISVDIRDLSQLQGAFETVSSRTEPIESLHHAVNSKVEDVFFALYRDFPDENRVTGEEKF